MNVTDLFPVIASTGVGYVIIMAVLAFDVICYLAIILCANVLIAIDSRVNWFGWKKKLTRPMETQAPINPDVEVEAPSAIGGEKMMEKSRKALQEMAENKRRPRYDGFFVIGFIGLAYVNLFAYSVAAAMLLFEVSILVLYVGVDGQGVGTLIAALVILLSYVYSPFWHWYTASKRFHTNTNMLLIWSKYVATMQKMWGEIEEVTFFRIRIRNVFQAMKTDTKEGHSVVFYSHIDIPLQLALNDIVSTELPDEYDIAKQLQEQYANSNTQVVGDAKSYIHHQQEYDLRNKLSVI